MLAFMWNEYLPRILTVEPIRKSPINIRDRVNWPDLSDPLFKNPPYVDPFVIIMLQTGVITPKVPTKEIATTPDYTLYVIGAVVLVLVIIGVYFVVVRRKEL